jgi:hypothetical protein
MLIEEGGLTVVKTCDSITLHSRICNPTTKIEDGEGWLIFTRPSTVSAITAETQRLDWSSAEIKWSIGFVLTVHCSSFSDF